MWEARGDAEALVRWWRDEACAQLPGSVAVELFRSADRVVALIRGGDAPRLPVPPAGLVSRPPHSWPFETVD